MGRPSLDGSGFVIASYGYDLQGNRTSETDLHGHLTTSVYDGLYRPVRILAPPVPGEGPAAPARNYVTLRRYDLVGNKVFEQDGNGHATRWVYDFADRLSSMTDPAGRVLRRGYDKNGNLTLEASEAGGIEQFRRETTAYDGLNRPLQVTETVQDQGAALVYGQQNAYDDAAHVAYLRDRRGAITTRELDDLDRVIHEVVDDGSVAPLMRQVDPSAGPPVGIEKRYEYDADGNRSRITDPRANVTVEIYDGLDRLIDRTLPMGVTEHFAYDGMSKVILHTDVRGVQHRTTYDLIGRAVIETVGADLRVVRRSYVDASADDGSWTLQEQDANGHSVVHTYDGLHREVSTLDPTGKTSRAYFDAAMKRAAADRKGFITLFDYDGANRLLAQRELELDGSVRFSQTTLYDDRARIETLTDRRGISTARLRDGLGRVVRTTRGAAPDVQSSSTSYDPSGNAVREVDANQHVTVLVFDGANRRIAETRGSGTADETTTRFTLDPNGNRIEHSNPRTGAFVTHDEYDALNRLVRSEDALGNVTLRAYDAGGNVLCEKTPLGLATLARGAAAVLDLAAELAASCSGAYVTQHEYDDLAKLTRTVDALGGDWRFTYDPVRNLVARKDANGNLTTYEYNARNERIAEHQHLDAHPGLVTADNAPLAEAPVDVDFRIGTLDWAWTYDANGNVATKTDPKGQSVGYTYGVLDRLASENWSGQALPRELPSLDGVDREYDPNGNLVHVVEHKLTSTGAIAEETVRVFDGLDRLKTETRYDGKLLSYSYDAKGNRLSVTDPDQVATSYTYDALDRLATATLPEGTASYSYWPDSLQKGIALPNRIDESRSYDLASRLTSIVTDVSNFTYTYDANGNRAKQIEQRTDPATQVLRSAETTTYGYDALDRLTGVKYPDGHAVLYRLDAIGNRTGEREAPAYAGTLDANAFPSVTNPSRDVTADFDRADWLRTRSDAVDRSRDVFYSYDLNGNLIRKQQATTTRELRWDARNTLTAVLDNGAVTSRYDYCYSGLRVKRSAQGQQVEYVLDDKFVLSEQDGSVGTHPMRRRYHYSTQPLAESEVSGASRFTTWLNIEAQGSVTDATQTDGSVRSARQYDAWGQYRNGTAPRADQPKLGYTGHQFDAETGLVYARARYYDPELGLFLSRDPKTAAVQDAPWLHRYLYGRSNPLAFVDKSGEASVRTEIQRSLDEARAAGDVWSARGFEVLKTAWAIADYASVGTVSRLDAIADADSTNGAARYRGEYGTLTYVGDVAGEVGFGAARIALKSVLGKAGPVVNVLYSAFQNPDSLKDTVENARQFIESGGSREIPPTPRQVFRALPNDVPGVNLAKRAEKFERIVSTEPGDIDPDDVARLVGLLPEDSEPRGIDPGGETFDDPEPRSYRTGGTPADSVVDHILNRARAGDPTASDNQTTRPYEQNARKGGFEGNYAKDFKRLRDQGLSAEEARYVLQGEDEFIRQDVHPRPVDPQLLKDVLEGSEQQDE